ncbi:methyl-accepting chemotaxis protein [Paraburkholderia sacchari]|uniref:methyl-accepting chemotaxis protein n=1 Tax=Paraburkholderia sacchari TaxID=159450 RepID=UPI0039A45E81
MIRIRPISGRVQRLYASLKSRYPDGFSLDPEQYVNVGDHATPLLMSGSRQITLDHAPLDAWGGQTGAVASIFVLTGDDLVRIATNIKSADGVRAVGAVMDRSHPAYVCNRAGSPYYGYAVLAGRKFVVDYRSILDVNGRTIGCFAVGLDVSGMHTLALAEKVSAGVAIGTATLLVARDFIEAALGYAQTPRAGQWLTSFGISALLGLAVRAVIERFAGRPLREAAEAAQRLASGDLSTQIPVKRGDEIGRILDAQNGVNIGLATLIGRVREATINLTSAVEEIAAGNENLSMRTDAQASSLEQTAAAMEELTSTVRSNADNVREALTSAKSATQLANDGSTLMERAVGTMGEIREASHRMSDIISTIEDIAFQTNILALNAAVEAARAGAEGRGFAVVAQEVRMLAKRSADAAHEIKNLISKAVSKIDTEGELVDVTGRNMSQIVVSIQDVTHLMAEISRASDAQSAGIDEINHAIAHLDDMTQQNASLVQQAAAASANMRLQTGALRTAVNAFKLAAD